MKKHVLIAAIALAASASAMAGSFYAGVGHQNTRLDAGQVASASVTDRNGYGARVLAGYQMTPHWAVEAAYGHARSMAAGASLKGHETSVALVAHHPLPHKLAAIGKVGVSHSRLDTGTQDLSKNSVLLGAGISYAVSSDVSVRTEWERTQNFGRSQDHAHKLAVSVIKAF